MEVAEEVPESAQVSVKNIGGIDEAEIELEPGVTSLTGRNATNRTSLLRAIMAALGSESVPLKADADHGSVELAIGDETHTREVVRKGGSLVTRGDPYLDDPELAELFAFLLESNEARQAVSRQRNLRDIIMRPVDMAALRAEISEVEQRRQEIDRRLERLDELNERLPDLEAKRARIESEIQAKSEELEAKRGEFEEANATVEETREKESTLDTALEELDELRSELETVRFRLESERESIDGLRADLEEFESRRENVPDDPAEDIEVVESEIEDLRSEKQRVESTLDQLQSVVRFNEEMLEGTDSAVAAALRDEEPAGDSLTSQLVETDSTIVCWTCGSSVERSQIEATLERLRELARENRSRREELRSTIQDRVSEKRSLESQQQEYRELERRIQQTRDEIEKRRNHAEELERRKRDLTSDIESLEREVEELDAKDQSAVLELHEEINQLEFDIEQLESERETVEEEIRDIEDRLDDRDRLEAEREDVAEKLAELRSRVDRIERNAVEQFNDHMDSILEILDYANIERIWIERSETERSGRRPNSQFDIHLVRSTASDAVYEDTIAHLSESEREVTGLVFALAGYLVHEVYDQLPFMLLDSLEAIDSDRMAKLVDYFDDYAPYVVVALLPEDAAALRDDHAEITEI